MNFLSHAVVTSIALTALSLPSYADAVVFPVVGEYDRGNTVDKNAVFYAGNSTGAGADETLLIDIQGFRATIKSAFSNGCGGVVNFDNATITGGEQIDTFAARYGSKSLGVKSIDHLRTDYSSDICTPISGPDSELGGGFLAKSNVNGDKIAIRGSYNFTFAGIDSSPGEQIQAVGGTILGRNGGRPTSKWLMKVTLDNGDIIAAMADIDFNTGKSKDDTFFGARAPSGRYITGVAWLCLDGSFSGLDGFAFITSGGEQPVDDVSSSSSSDTSRTNSAASTNEDYSLLFGY